MHGLKRGQIPGIGSPVPLCGFQGSNLGPQVWQEASLPSERSWQPICGFSNRLILLQNVNMSNQKSVNKIVKLSRMVNTSHDMLWL